MLLSFITGDGAKLSSAFQTTKYKMTLVQKFLTTPVMCADDGVLVC
jgi:hypothetical protein